MNLKDVLKPKSKEDILSILKSSDIEITNELIDITSIDSRCKQHTMIQRCYINGVEYDYSLIKNYL